MLLLARKAVVEGVTGGTEEGRDDVVSQERVTELSVITADPSATPTTNTNTNTDINTKTTDIDATTTTASSSKPSTKSGTKLKAPPLLRGGSLSNSTPTLLARPNHRWPDELLAGQGGVVAAINCGGGAFVSQDKVRARRWWGVFPRPALP